MTNNFIEEYGTLFNNDLKDDEVVKVIKFILTLKHDDSIKRSLIQQFMLNLIDVESIYNKRCKND